MIGDVQRAEDLQEIVRSTAPGTRLLPVGGQTKPGLSDPLVDGFERVDVSGLTGITEYDPAELTITARAGTPVSEIEAALAEHGQYLPFDPPLAAAGATLGGTVAAGASGPNALRYGGLRDFVIGVRFIDGKGRLVSGGGKVVKNAAGFDLPKLLSGSIGRLGMIVSLSFKVFPRPAETVTLEFAGDGSLGSGLAAAAALARCPVELDALDLYGDGTVLARVGGRPESLEARADRLAASVADPAVRHRGDEEAAMWQRASELAWRPADASLVRVALSSRRLPDLQQELIAAGPAVHARYSLGGTVAWISWPSAVPLARLEALLDGLELPGLLLIGAGPTRLGPRTGGAFADRVKHALDPDSRFLEV